MKDRSQETKRRRNFFSQSFIPLLSSRQSFLHSYIVSRSSLPLPFFSLPTFTLRERLTDERTPPSNYYYIKRFPWLFAPLTNDGGARSSSPCTEPLANSKVITSHGGRALCSRLSRNNSLSLAVLRALPFSSTSPFFIHPLSPPQNIDESVGAQRAHRVVEPTTLCAFTLPWISFFPRRGTWRISSEAS